MPLQSGETLRNRYRIKEILGQGGMGAVYRAVDINLGVEVAVKENLFTTKDYARQFRREATILASLRHSNLPRVTDHFVIEGEGQYLVMDFVEGEDLRERLERDGFVEESEVIPWFLEVCDALAYLHSRSPSILHRDIKPGNIKITPDGKAILVDFGLAKVVDDSGETTTGAKAMTPGFSPPEQYGSGRTDHRTDIYSLAATLYTALTASIPEDSLERAMGRATLSGIRKRNPEVTPSIARAVERGLALDPEQRYQTMGQFAEALEEAAPAAKTRARGELSYLRETVVGGQKTQAASTRTQLAAAGRVGRRRWPIVAVVVLAVLIITLGAAYALPSVSTAVAGIFGPGGEDSNGLPTSVPAAGGDPTATTSGGAATPSGGDPTAIPGGAATEAATSTGGNGQTPTPQGGGVGQLAFASARSGIPQVYLVNIDGTGVEQLTDLSEGACQPAWSPDGSQIAFTSPCRANRDQYPGSSVWLMNADGSSQKVLATAPGGDYDPAWSPQGDRIAFTSLQDGWPQVNLIGVDGSGRENISGTSAHESKPSFSPSGSQIIYISTRSGVSEVWIMAADGSDPQRFSRSEERNNHLPSWSPDGELVIFDQEIGGVRRLVTTQYREGGAPEVRICPEGPLSVQPMAEPQWSPDGKWLSFETWPDGTNHNIAVITSSCSGYTEITEDEALDFDATWRP